MKRPAFTLIEMLVATVLSAVLMAAVLAAVAGVARDRRALRSMQAPTAAATADLIEWDLRNARTMSREPGVELILVGNGGIRQSTHQPDGRLVRVTYRTAGDALWRQQEYLDDPVRPAKWQELVAGRFRGLTLPIGVDDAPVPARITFAVALASATEKREVMR